MKRIVVAALLVGSAVGWRSCGHGSIGVAVTLAWLGRIGRGVSRLETPVGVVAVDLVDDNTVTVENVPSYRFRKDVTVEVAGLGPVTGGSRQKGAGSYHSRATG